MAYHSLDKFVWFCFSKLKQTGRALLSCLNTCTSCFQRMCYYRERYIIYHQCIENIKWYDISVLRIPTAIWLKEFLYCEWVEENRVCKRHFASQSEQRKTIYSFKTAPVSSWFKTAVNQNVRSRSGSIHCFELASSYDNIFYNILSEEALRKYTRQTNYYLFPRTLQQQKSSLIPIMYKKLRGLMTDSSQSQFS